MREWYQRNRERVDAKNKAWVEANRERAAGHAKKWKLANPEKVKSAKYLALYGITSEQVRALEIHQQGECRLCGVKAKLVVDHNHTTGEVRSLLCKNCNTGLGMLQDSSILLRLAASYLD